MAGEWKELLKDANLDPAQRTQLEKAIADIDVLAGSVLDNGVKRQADYSRHMNELSEKSRAYDANATALAEQYNQLVAYTDAVEAERDAAQQALTSKVEPTTTPIVGAAPATSATVTTPVTVTPAGFTREETQKLIEDRARELAAGTAGYFGSVLSISHQHRQLFGKDIDPSDLIKQAMLAKETPDAYWKKTYNPDARREELAKKADEERVTKIREEERAKVMSELANPATRPLQASENPFYSPAGNDKDSDPFADVETEGDRGMLDALSKIA
jgi:hypothetical protein